MLFCSDRKTLQISSRPFLKRFLTFISAEQAAVEHPDVRPLFDPFGFAVGRHVHSGLCGNPARTLPAVRQQLPPDRHPDLQRHQIQRFQVKH